MPSLKTLINKKEAVERWAIIGRTNYAVSTKGRVRNLKTGRLLKHQKSKRGGYYPFVNIYIQKIRLNRTVHGLVAEAFLGLRPTGYEVHHKDSNISNPSADNLEYVTPKKNKELRRKRV